jgi:uncharacterized membrane protein
MFAFNKISGLRGGVQYLMSGRVLIAVFALKFTGAIVLIFLMILSDPILFHVYGVIF